MRARWCCGLAVLACRFTNGSSPGAHQDAGALDAVDGAIRRDSFMLVGDTPTCFDAADVAHGELLHVCLDGMPPPGTLTISSTTTIATTSSASCAPLAPASGSACVLTSQDIVIDAGAALGASGGSGSPPLVLYASTITINGLLDVASHQSGAAMFPGQVGAAADNGSCNPGMAPTMRAGGAGGSYATTGGNGGDEANQGGSHGVAGKTIAIGAFGGCPGQAGALVGTSASPGDGGGALIAVATTQLTMSSVGVIDASGMGGGAAGSGNTRGGGGGGAGGVIWLQAPDVTLGSGAQVYANGGGGGGGTSTASGDTSGQDPTSATAAPQGGSAAGEAGSGGSGYYASNNATNGANGSGDASSSDGGGGGGGGAGYIVIVTGSLHDTGAAISPPASD